VRNRLYSPEQACKPSFIVVPCNFIAFFTIPMLKSVSWLKEHSFNNLKVETKFPLYTIRKTLMVSSYLRLPLRLEQLQAVRWKIDYRKYGTRHHLATHSKKTGVKIPIPRHKKDIPIGTLHNILKACRRAWSY